VEICFDVNQKHAKALLKLIDLLDYQVVRSCAASEQEAYDMVLALDCVRTALKANDVRWGDNNE
jgi:hypothetical protein